MPTTITDLETKFNQLQLLVKTYDFKINSMQLTLNLLESRLNNQTIYVKDNGQLTELTQYLNGKTLTLVG